MNSSVAAKAYPVLPLADRLLILAIAVTQFLIGHGRVWAKPFDWDRSIVFSYVTIAVLIFADLAVRRRLKFVSWFLHSLELFGIKFGLTAGFLLLFLVTHPTPGQPAAAELPPIAPPSETPRPMEVKDLSIIPEQQRGEISGKVVNHAGQAISGALVFISEGLEKFVFAAPREPTFLENDGRRFLPSLAVVQVGQPLVVRSANRELHTLLMMKRDRSWIFNVPMLASGEGRSLLLKDAKGLVSVHCTVHGKREGEAYLAILSHPFFTFSDADGMFRLHRVPTGSVVAFAFHPTEGEASAPSMLAGGAQIQATLVLRRSPH